MAHPLAARRDVMLDLARSLRFERPDTADSARHTFMGKLAYLEFWETEATRPLARWLAGAAKISTPRLHHSDKNTLADLLIETIKTRLFDPVFFKLAYPPRGALFDGISSPDKGLFADRLWAEFLAAAEATVDAWLTLHPAPKLTLAVPSTQFGNVHVIASHDRAAWQALEHRFPAIVGLTPDVGIFHADPAVYNFNVQPETWLAVENSGTADAARLQATRDLGGALALIIALSRTPGRFVRGAADPMVRVVQLAERKGAERTIHFAPIGEILPPLLSPVRIDPAMQAAIASWYALKALAPALAIRAATGAACYHQALLTEDRERFLHFFTALDALFGAPFQIKKQLELAARRLFPDDPAWIERTAKLFELRHLLVHGAIASLADWPDEDDYFIRYRSTALDDATTLATAALVRYFDLPG